MTTSSWLHLSSNCKFTLRIEVRSRVRALPPNRRRWNAYRAQWETSDKDCETGWETVDTDWERVSIRGAILRYIDCETVVQTERKAERQQKQASASDFAQSLRLCLLVRVVLCDSPRGTQCIWKVYWQRDRLQDSRAGWETSYCDQTLYNGDYWQLLCWLPVTESSSFGRYLSSGIFDYCVTHEESSHYIKSAVVQICFLQLVDHYQQHCSFE